MGHRQARQQGDRVPQQRPIGTAGQAVEQRHKQDEGDIEEDRKFGAKTVPVRLGENASRWIVLLSLGAAWLLCFALIRVSPAGFGPVADAAVFIGGIYLLLLPAWRLFRSRERNDAMALFNKASYVPPALALLVGCRLLF